MGVAKIVNRSGGTFVRERYYINRSLGKARSPIDDVLEHVPVPGGGGTTPPTTPALDPGVFLGIWHTDKELVIWRERAEVGPYNTKINPVHGGTIGDWDRVVRDKNTLKANGAIQNTTARLFQIPMPDFDFAYPAYGNNRSKTPNTTDLTTRDDGTTYLDPNRYNKEPKTEGVLLKNAAYWALIRQPKEAVEADQMAVICRDLLMQVVACPGLDWPPINGFNTRYPKYYSDLAFWITGECMMRYILTYNYLHRYELTGGTALFTPAQKTSMLNWLERFDNYFTRNVHDSIRKILPKRMNNEYSTNISYTRPEKGNYYTHMNADGSLGYDLSAQPAAFFNNRRLAQLAAAFWANCTLRSQGRTPANVVFTQKEGTVNVTYTFTSEFHATQTIKEWLKYSVYPNGAQGEMERSKSATGGGQYTGLNYSGDNLFHAGSVICLAARMGVRELIDYKTTINHVLQPAYDIQTATGPQTVPAKFVTVLNGPEKSIQLPFIFHASLDLETNPAKFIYWTDRLGGDFRSPECRLSHNQIGWNKKYVREGRYACLNSYWNNPIIKAAVEKPMPTSGIGDAAGDQDWDGPGQIMSGMRFMFAKMEGKVYPFPSSRLF